MNLVPDPVEIASDELYLIMSKSPRSVLQDIHRLINALPVSRQFHGAVRLLSDHMSEFFNRNNYIDPKQYDSFGEATVKLAAKETLSLIKPTVGMGIPIFRDESANYNLKKLIARGGFGSVWLSQDNVHNSYVAIKTPWEPKDSSRSWDNSVKQLSSEANILRHLDHPGIISYIDTVKDMADVSYLVTEYLEGGDLSNQSGHVDLDIAVHWAIQISKAVDYLRHQAIIHRDISLDNIGLDGHNNPKIIDFGLAINLENRLDYEHQQVGTPGYLILNKPSFYNRILGCNYDVINIGMVLVKLHSHTPVVFQKDGQFVWDNSDPQTQAYIDSIPEKLRNILNRCFDCNKEYRYPTAGHLADELLSISRLSPLQAWWAGERIAKLQINLGHVMRKILYIGIGPSRIPRNMFLKLKKSSCDNIVEQFACLERMLEMTIFPLPPNLNYRDIVKDIQGYTITEAIRRQSDVAKLFEIYKQTVNLIRKVCCRHGGVSGTLLDLSIYIHSLYNPKIIKELANYYQDIPDIKDYPDLIHDLTNKVNFPESLTSNLHEAAYGFGDVNIRSIIVSYDAYAESTLD